MLRAASSLRHLRHFRGASALRPRILAVLDSTAADNERSTTQNDTFVVPPIVCSVPDGTASFVGQRRLMSTAPGGDNNDTSSFDETMDKLFADQETTTAAVDAASATASTAAQVWDPSWYNLADQAINIINFFHAATGLNYAYSIVGITCIARVLLFPIFVKGQRAQSRMAHMQPELQAIKAKIDQLGPDADRETQVKFGLQMKALFKKYDCNPLASMVIPLAQAPFFMSMFFGLRKMPDYFPEELSTGGILWFTDLTVPDPYYILPSLSALSFLIMIENGKEQMMATNPAQGEMMVNIFRGMSIIMFPVACSFSTAVLCYWVTNNTITLMQSTAFHNPTVRKKLGIWDPPKPIPGATPKSFVESVQDAAGKLQGTVVSEEQKMKAHNEAIENRKNAAKLSKAARVKRDGRFSRQKVKR